MKIFILLTLFFLIFHNSHASAPRPKLVLVIVYDQFRADYLTRFRERYLPAVKDKKIGGFRYLMEKGSYYPLAEYTALQNMTCPGHATILSGAPPRSTGIPLNEWWDQKLEKIVYCAEDAEFGISPRHFQGSTVGDELKLISPQSRVIGVALKDRAGVMLAGPSADLALWMETSPLRWTTSGYYMKDGSVPEWLKKLNARVQNDEKKEISWISRWSSQKFSHTAKADSDDAFATPWGGDLTVEAALALIDAYQLGQQNATDLLAVSFSSHDLAGHRYGPNSPEMEDLSFAEDEQLSRFLNAVDKKIKGGLSQVLIVLTADHGIVSTVAFSKSHKLDAGTIDQKQLQEDLNKKLSERLGSLSKGEWIVAYKSFNLYFNKDIPEEKRSQAEALAKSILMTAPGVLDVIVASEFFHGRAPLTLTDQQAARSLFTNRSGDLVLVPKPFWYEKSRPTTTHMTGYSYDRYVPLLLAGPRIKALTHAENAKIIDLAPTLSFLLGTVPPALSEGRVLSEALKP